jgi:hypothetical protein
VAGWLLLCAWLPPVARLAGACAGLGLGRWLAGSSQSGDTPPRSALAAFYREASKRLALEDKVTREEREGKQPESR